MAIAEVEVFVTTIWWDSSLATLTECSVCGPVDVSRETTARESADRHLLSTHKRTATEERTWPAR